MGRGRDRGDAYGGNRERERDRDYGRGCIFKFYEISRLFGL